MQRLHRQKDAGRFAHTTVDAGWDGLRELAQVDRVRGTPLTMNQRPPRPIFVCCALWCLTACANTTAGTDGGAVDAASEGAVGDAGADALPPAMWPQPDPTAPRLIAPLSCTWHSSRRPTLRWALPPGVERVVVEVCADRPCQRVEHTLEVTGSSVRVPEELRPGVHFWRAFALVDGRRGAGSFTWEFRAPFRSAPNDLAIGTYVDVNGDGYGDALFGAGNGLAPVVNYGLYIYFGGPNGPSTTYNQRIPEGGAYDAGDVNGDGFSDVILSYRPGNELVPTLRRVYLGSSGGLLETTQQLGQNRPGMVWGGSFSSLGDTDRDGYADVSYTFGGSEYPSGPTTIFLGSPAGYNPDRSFELVRPDPRFQDFGVLYQAGDFDGDDRVDYVVEGASYLNPDHPKVTQLWVIAGERLHDFARHARMLVPPEGHEFFSTEYRDRFKYCDLNGDGRTELLVQSVSLADVRVAPLNVYLHTAAAGPIVRASIFDGGTLVQQRANSLLDVTCVPDFDGDGFNDLIGTSYGSLVSWAIRGSVSGGTNAVAFSSDLRTFASRASRRATNDIDGDGRADCIVAGGPDALVFAAHNDVSMLSIRYRIPDPGASGDNGGPGPFGRGFLF